MHRSDPTGQSDVVVLHEDGVVQPHAMVDAAPVADRGLLQRTKSGGGLACVDDPDARAVHQIDHAGSARRHGRETSEEVQGRPFGGDDGAGRSGDLADDITGFDAITVGPHPGDLKPHIDGSTCRLNHRGARDHRIFAGHDPCSSRLILIEGRHQCEVTDIAQILDQDPLHQFVQSHCDHAVAPFVASDGSSTRRCAPRLFR